MPMQPQSNVNRLSTNDFHEEQNRVDQSPQQIQSQFQNQQHQSHQPTPLQSFPAQQNIHPHHGYNQVAQVQGVPIQQPHQSQNVQTFNTAVQPGIQMQEQANQTFQQQQEEQWQQQQLQMQLQHNINQYTVTAQASDPHPIQQECQPTPQQSNSQVDNIQNLQNMIQKTKFYQVGRVLELMAETGDVIPHANSIITPLHSTEIPKYSIIWYFVILSYNAGLQDEQAPAVLVLIERLCNTAAQQGAPIIINSYTVHRLILTTVLITSKFYNDIYFANQYIASVGGVPTVNLNQLENFFLEMIDWNLYISPEDFDKFDGYALELANYASDQQNQLQQPKSPVLQGEQMLLQNSGSTDPSSVSGTAQTGNIMQQSPQQVLTPQQNQSPEQMLQQQQRMVQQLSPQPNPFQAQLQAQLAAQPQQNPVYMSPIVQAQLGIQQAQMQYQQRHSFDDAHSMNQVAAQNQQHIAQQMYLQQEQQRRMSYDEFQQQQMVLVQQQQEIQRRISQEYQQQSYFQQQQLLNYQAQQLQAQNQQQVQQIALANIQTQQDQSVFQGQVHAHAQQPQNQLIQGREINILPQQMQSQDMNQMSQQQQQYLLLQQQQQQQLKQQQQQQSQQQQQQLGNNYPGANQN